MTVATSPRAATEGTWALPLLTLVPLAVITLLTELSTPWLVISWILCAVAALFIVVGWVSVFRHGMRGAGAWGMCILVHAVWAWQLITVVRH
ncbi:hypothetical protein PZB75_29965 [Streptomyces sp. AM 4-1-1]|uniref:hypothetical protein n=1 Tax=unclassified Streptomyces TaxID=2593676 RepID=UPI0023B9F289|nr:hypothetical protein [Streptomyces sp. AM 4-1-1]WEH37223.1 hypothetical protein PZB75_29965 [Streptomyces sp. AM 4-1-1]